MRLLNWLLFSFILFIGSGSIINSDEAAKAIQELDNIGKTNDPLLLDRKAITSNSLALFYQSIDDNEQAIIFMKRAIQLSEKRIRIENQWNAQDYHDLQSLYLNLAKIQGTAQHIHEARRSILEAEKYFVALKATLSPVEFYENATEFYGTAFAWAFHGREFELAETYGKKALGFARKSQSKKLISEAYRSLGEVYRANGNPEKALELFDAAIETIEDSQFPLDQALIQSKIGTLYSSRQYASVIEFMESVFTYSSPDQLESQVKKFSASEYNGILENVFILSYAYIRQYQIEGSPQLLDLAQSWQNIAYQLAENSMFENGIDRLGQIINNPEQKITSTLKNYELLEQVDALSQNEIAQLLRTVDVYHASQLHINRLKDENNQENWENQRALRKQLKTIFDELQDLSGNDQKVDSLQNLAFQISSNLAHLSSATKRDEIAKEYKLGQTAFTNKLQKYTLRNKKTILTYFWSNQLSRLYIIGRNPRHYFFKSIEVDNDFQSTINNSYQLNSGFLTNLEDLRRQDSLNHALYKLMVAPVRNELTTKNLLVYPIGSMSYVSIDALRPETSRYFIEDFNTSYTTSLFALLRPKKKHANKSTVVAFYPKKYGSDSLTELFHVRNEISTLDSCVATETLEGKRATKQRFLSEKSAAKILHVGSHSILDHKNPFNSYLIFEEQDSPKDFQLKASEVFTKSFNADLIVLSSCNSAMGTSGNEIGIISLSNAFYFSGVPATLGSLWSAQDKSSSAIISGFYRNLFQSRNKSMSLTLAKRSYLSKADNIKRQPFFWANYVMYGSDEPVITKDDKSDNWIYFLLAVMLISPVIFVIYKRSRRSLALPK